MLEESHSTAESTESIALGLALEISDSENLHQDAATYRQKLLDLYAECLVAVRGNRHLLKKSKTLGGK